MRQPNDGHVTARGARSADDLPTTPPTDLTFLLGVDHARAADTLEDLVLDALGRRPIGRTAVDTIARSLGSPATGGVYRVSGRAADGHRWSMVCKVLQHVRHWPGLRQMPPPIAAEFCETFPWRAELELWDPRVQASLPAGLRSPRLHRLVELPDDRVAVWQEDIDQAGTTWDDAAYATAARLLGRWNARSTGPEVLAVSGAPIGLALRKYAEIAVPMRGLPALRDERLWSHPWLAGHRDLAAELTAWGGRIPRLLDRLDTFVQALPHGDASPQNLLVPVADDAALVAIDVSFRSPQALGFDLGQLLIGLVHCDEVPADRLPGIAAVIVPAYLDGLAAEGLTVDPDDVREAFATSTLLRSGFDGFLYDELDDADPTAPPNGTFAQRIDLARFLVQLHRDTTHLRDRPDPREQDRHDA